jgi:hypothetical protein
MEMEVWRCEVMELRIGSEEADIRESDVRASMWP